MLPAMRVGPAVLLLGLAGCGCGGGPSDPVVSASPPAPAPAPAAALPALPVVDAELLRAHTRELSSDAYEGRKPGTAGGAKAVAYVEAQMQALGLRPGGDEGGFRQRVPMRGITVDPSRSALTVTGRGGEVALAPGTDAVAVSWLSAGTIQLDAELVFVGYGVTARNEEWDDWDEIDMRGRIAVVLVGDPPVPDGRFGGGQMTYYGRWSYKFERALEAGALGCLVVHDPEAAAYGWNVVQGSWGAERFQVVEPGGALPSSLRVEGWLHRDAAERLAQRAGSTLDGWRAAAIDPSFRPIETGLSLTGQIVTRERRLSDDNVVGEIPGTTRADEVVLVTAHWDHMGIDDTAPAGADAIFNGAVDNASGIAGMLASAARLQQRAREGRGPQRTIVFLATTAEEQGLLGSRYYAEHPPRPLANVAGVVNLDSMNVHGRTRSIAVIGAGQSTLEDVLDDVAHAQGRALVPDEYPEAGSYYRSDHFSFARRGVPGLYFRAGTDFEDGGPEVGAARARDSAARYHTIDDEYDPSWSFAGTLQDVEALVEVVQRVADAGAKPAWKPASEFAAIAR
jgi:Zn-dependent M28 family amino/carboxypeptidase